MQVFVRDDLIQTGWTEDGDVALKRRHYVVAETPNGARFAHDRVFVGHLHGDDEAAQDAAALLTKVEAHLAIGGKLDPDHWNEVDPRYGSEAYQSLDAWGYFRARERREAFDAGEPIILNEVGDYHN